ncbi:MAG: hypothetical protein ACRDKT_02020 [Actinomycetota bacterium]
MPENEGRETPQLEPWWKKRWAQGLAGLGTLGIVILIYQFCGIEPAQEFGVVRSDGGIVDEESPEDSDEPDAAETESEATSTESRLGFSVSSGVYHLVFSNGSTGPKSCNFPESFEIDARFDLQGERIVTEQEGSGQMTRGRFDPDTGRFETRGQGGGHVEIFQGMFTGPNTFRGNYSIFQDCDQHWRLRGMRRR